MHTIQWITVLVEIHVWSEKSLAVKTNDGEYGLGRGFVLIKTSVTEAIVVPCAVRRRWDHHTYVAKYLGWRFLPRPHLFLVKSDA